jgi:Domain of Unknown Function with PDB structure (DUF3857)/Transglutaminase-like superfamily
MIPRSFVPATKNVSTNAAVILSEVWRVLSAKRSRRTCICFCLLLLLALASPALLRAQFQKPADDELRMTAEPKAPGAAAVYLYREENTDDSSDGDCIQIFYERIKVLTEKGKEMATISIPYQQGITKVTDIQGRTIRPNGIIIPFTAKPDDLTDFKTKDLQKHTLVFTLPGVEVGSILEYRYRFTGQIPAPTWWIQQKYFVRKAHYLYVPNRSVSQMFETFIGSDARVSCCKNNSYTLDISDVPPMPDEDWMPPLNSFRWRVEFFYTQFSTGKEFWDSVGKSWATAVQDFTNPTAGLKKAVADIVAPADTDQQKAVKIYAAVQKLDNTVFSRQKSQAERRKEKIKDVHKAEDVWKQQSGTDDEMALLYVALARAAGLRAWPMKVVDRSRAIFDDSYLTIRQLDDYLAIVVVDGKEIYLDPGQKMCPFGSLHWKHTLASGLRISDKGTVIESTPDSIYKDSVVQQTADLSISEDGSVKGTASVVLTGPGALYWRQLALQNDEEEVKKQFIESIHDSLPDGVQAVFDHFLGLEDYSGNLSGFVQISGNLGSLTGKHLFLPGLFFESRAKHPFVEQDIRITTVDLHFPKMEQDDVTFHLPPGYAVEGVPQTSDVNWPDRASLQINSTIKDGSVEVRRSFARYFHLLDSSEYNRLQDFYLKLAAADQQQLVLTKSPTAQKGN